MTGPATLRWRLVVWVVGAMAIVSAVMFVVVYEQTGSQLRHPGSTRTSRGDVSQLSEAVRALRTQSPTRLAAQLRAYVQAQPSRGNHLPAVRRGPGSGTVTNHPELLGADRPDDGETAAEQQRENAQARALLIGPIGQRTVRAPDLGPVRIDERLISRRRSTGPARCRGVTAGGATGTTQRGQVVSDRRCARPAAGSDRVLSGR